MDPHPELFKVQCRYILASATGSSKPEDEVAKLDSNAKTDAAEHDITTTATS